MASNQTWRDFEIIGALGARGQAEVIDQRRDLAPRRLLRRREVVVGLLDGVHRREAEREQFAENDAVMEAFGDAELQFHRKFAQGVVDLAGVVGLQGRDAVAHQNPVDQAIIHQAALAPGLEDDFSILRDEAALPPVVMDAREHVHVDETVVHRRDQGVGQRMGEPHQVGIACRRVDHDEFVIMLNLADGFGESGEFGGFILLGV